MIKISEKSHHNENIRVQTEQELCSCGCKGQKEANFEKLKQKPMTQVKFDSDK